MQEQGGGGGETRVDHPSEPAQISLTASFSHAPPECVLKSTGGRRAVSSREARAGFCSVGAVHLCTQTDKKQSSTCVTGAEESGFRGARCSPVAAGRGQSQQKGAPVFIHRLSLASYAKLLQDRKKTGRRYKRNSWRAARHKQFTFC